MKATLFLPVILILAANALAQKAPEKKKPKDPFVRGGAPAATNPPPSDPANIYALIEYIEVPRELWLEYTSTNPVGHNSAPLRAEVQKWISEGKAKPIEISCEVTKSGNRTVSESIIERQFPTGYSPWNKVSLPIAFETRNSHLTFEWEPILSDDGSKVDSNLAIRLTKFAGNSFDTIEQRKSLQPDDIGQPLFVSYRTTLSVATSPSEPKLLDVMTPYDGSGKLREDACLLLFFRGSPVNIVLPEKGLPPDNHSLNLEVERLEVSLKDLNSWFADKDLVAGTQRLRDMAASWIKEGRGKVVDRRLSPARSGQRHVVENIFEVRYPIEYSPDPVISPSAYETRNTGFSVEAEPAIGPDGKVVDLSTAIFDTRYCGKSAVLRREENGQWIPEIERPIFATMKITTSVSTGINSPLLLGITTPVNDKTEPDPQKRILTFVTFRN